jgi:hypothetical protein
MDARAADALAASMQCEAERSLEVAEALATQLAAAVGRANTLAASLAELRSGGHRVWRGSRVGVTG